MQTYVKVNKGDHTHVGINETAVDEPIGFPPPLSIKIFSEDFKNNDGWIPTPGDADLIGLRKGLGGSIFLSYLSDCDVRLRLIILQQCFPNVKEYSSHLGIFFSTLCDSVGL